MYYSAKRSRLPLIVIWLVSASMCFCLENVTAGANDSVLPFELNEKHLTALNRRRRLMLHYDYTGHTMKTTPWGKLGPGELGQVVDFYEAPYQKASTEFVDTIVYELGEGPAVWPSEIVPRVKFVFPKWWEAGIDPLGTLVDIAKQQGREVFLSYRLNGTDIEEDSEYGNWKLPEFKEQHKEWLVKTPWHLWLWNFGYQGVREDKLEVLREVASRYDIDGLQIDLARSAILFPAGEQWENVNT